MSDQGFSVFESVLKDTYTNWKAELSLINGTKILIPREAVVTEEEDIDVFYAFGIMRGYTGTRWLQFVHKGILHQIRRDQIAYIRWFNQEEK